MVKVQEFGRYAVLWERTSPADPPQRACLTVPVYVPVAAPAAAPVTLVPASAPASIVMAAIPPAAPPVRASPAPPAPPAVPPVRVSASLVVAPSTTTSTAPAAAQTPLSKPVAPASP